jgi:hypothetical protein
MFCSPISVGSEEGSLLLAHGDLLPAFAAARGGEELDSTLWAGDKDRKKCETVDSD